MKSEKEFLSASVSFTEDDILEQCNNENNPNLDAWINLYNAICTPDFCPDEEYRDGKYHNMIYPVSMAETLEMERRLELAQKAKVEPDEKFDQIYDEMQEVVNWSKTKHFQCSYSILICFIIATMFMSIFPPKLVQRFFYDKDMSYVEKWKEENIVFDEIQTREHKDFGDDLYKTAYNYKYNILNNITEKIDKLRTEVEQESDPKKIDLINSKIQSYTDLYKEKNEESVSELKANLLKKIENEAQNKASSFLRIMLVLITILYLISCYQYGYNISRFLHFRESISKLLRIGASVSAAGAAAGAVVTTTTYSNGQKEETTQNPGVVLVLAGIAILFYLSTFIIIPATINGLYYNHIKPFIENSRNLKFNNTISDDRSLVSSEIIPETKKIKTIACGAKRIISRNFSKIFSTDGREGRISFLIYNLFIFICCVALLFVFVLLSWDITILYIIYPYFIITSFIRRLHDFGLPAWLILIPFVYIALPIIPGKKGENKYGLEPQNYFARK